MKSFFQQIRKAWLKALSEKNFKYAFIIGITSLTLLVSMLPIFYHYIENRKGIVLNDWILTHLRPTDLSIEIFTIIWGTVLFGIYRALLSPRMFIHFLYSYIFFIITRSTCLILVPLDPPVGLIELIDPVTNIFYGGTFMTKDLFYSGHTCAVILFGLAMEKKSEKITYFLLAIILGILLLLQHVHYTIDVIAAPIFGVICYKLSQTILHLWYFSAGRYNK